MALIDELDATIRGVSIEVRQLESEMEGLRREIARRRHMLSDALRLYQSCTGSSHALESSARDEQRERPRAEKVLAVMEEAGGPVTLSELIEAMPDRPDRGAISAVVHRAVRKGEVRRLKRGVYELAEHHARAS